MFQMEMLSSSSSQQSPFCDGVVRGIEGDIFEVCVGDGDEIIRCLLAEGSFLIPHKGDNVLVYCGGNHNFIVMVLRSDSGTRRINAADMEVCIRGGDLEVRGVSLEVEARDRLTFRTRHFFRYFENVFTWVRGIFQLTSRRLRFSVDEDVWLRGKRATILGKDKVRVDGDKIALG